MKQREKIPGWILLEAVGEGIIMVQVSHIQLYGNSYNKGYIMLSGRPRIIKVRELAEEIDKLILGVM